MQHYGRTKGESQDSDDFDRNAGPSLSLLSTPIGAMEEKLILVPAIRWFRYLGPLS